VWASGRPSARIIHRSVERRMNPGRGWCDYVGRQPTSPPPDPPAVYLERAPLPPAGLSVLELPRKNNGGDAPACLGAGRYRANAKGFKEK
jgi:hypothetical protein